MSQTFSVYVTSLSDYNAGILHGKWIDLDDCIDIGILQTNVQEMLAASPTAKKTGLPSEEYAIHDYEGFPPNSIAEYASLSYVWDLYKEYKKADDDGNLDAFIAFKTYYDDGSYESFLEKYQGQYSSKEDFAYEFLDSCGELDSIPIHLRYYFDYEAYTRDLFTDSYTFIDGYVFSNN